MDCAEGSYAQITDHFGGDTFRINSLILQTRVVFITHIHGDHQLGILKILHERDQLNPEDTMYVVTPSPMMEWMQLFV